MEKLSDQAGYIELEQGERFSEITQTQLKENSSVLNASKVFHLEIKQGPYQIAFTGNGRYFGFVGRKGHVGGFDRLTGKLIFERDFEDRIYDIVWLQNETMFATAQENYVYIYDRYGVEIHQLLEHRRPRSLEFLPYHFLLASASEDRFLRYHDITTGQLVCENSTKPSPVYSMCHNRNNGIIHTGHKNGTVCLWSPSSTKPLVKMLCHHGPVSSLDADLSGNYLVTSGVDRKMRVWDLRTYKVVDEYKSRVPIQGISVSQNGVVGTSCGESVITWKDVFKTKQEEPYLVEKKVGTVSSLKFCPFDDVLGLGTDTSIATLLVPGSGVAVFDALEENPFESAKQRQELEVKRLLEKIPADMIGISSVVNEKIVEEEEREKTPEEEAEALVPKDLEKKKRMKEVQRIAKELKKQRELAEKGKKKKKDPLIRFKSK